MNCLQWSCALMLAAQLGFGGVARASQDKVHFEANRGQFDAATKYVGRAADVTVGLFADGVGFETAGSPGRIRTRFLGISGSAQWAGTSMAPGRSNYFTAGASISNVDRYEGVRLAGLYPGIDLEIHGAGDRMEYDFIVHPGANPSRIEYAADASSVHLTPAGELVITQGAMEIRNRPPELYQEHNGQRTRVEGHFALRGKTVSFEVGAYDKRETLVIDPIVFTKTISTGFSSATATTTDSAGNIYLVGYADATFAATGVQKTFGGGDQDAIVAKYSSSGAPIWSTFIGGSGTDLGQAIMVDATGNVTIVGYTNSTNFPMVGASYQRNIGGKNDIFVVTLNAAGSAILYSTFLGGSNDDYATDAAMDASGNVVIGGYTSSTNFPTAGTPVLQSALSGTEDFFVAKVNVPTGTQLGQLLFSTYFGGSGRDDLWSLRLDASGNIYAAGDTTSTNLTATTGAAQAALAGQTDTVVVKFNPTATAVQFLTYLGGSLSESPTGFAVEPDGSVVWVATNTRSLNFPTSAAALQKTLAGNVDATISKFDNKGALLASTYIGGPNEDTANSILLQNGTPVLVAVLTTDQYNKAASDAVATIRQATTVPTLTFESMSTDLSSTTSTITYVPDPAFEYAGEAACQVSAADGNTVVCAATGFPPFNGTPNTRGVVLAATIGSASSGQTTSYPDIPAQRTVYSIDARPEPVDGATGSYYDVMRDLSLDGPLPLGFSRYYSSTLSKSGFLSPQGTNWMTNFDQRVDVVGSTARVLLFQGKVITFTKSGANWQLSSPLDTPYQFAQSGSSYKFMDPTAPLIYTFNSSGALTRMENRNGDAITVTQGPNGPTLASDGLGRTLTFTYTGARLTKVQDQTGLRAVSFTYTGTVLNSATDVLGQKTNYAYTSSGQLSSLMTARQYPLGTRTTQTYDASGRVVSQASPTNKVTAIAYNGQNTSITDPLGATTTQIFDANGAVVGFKDPLGSSFSATYDAAGRRTGYTDKLGNKVTITYDAASGKVASERSAAGITTSNTYTAQTQSGFTFYPRTGITYGDGTAVAITLDARGNPTAITDQRGGVTRYAYDSAGRLITYTLPSNATITFTYNQDATVATSTDASGTTTYAYDSMKRLIKITDPNTRVTNYAYDLAGNELTKQTPEGSTTSTTYDADGRRSVYTNAAGAAFTFAYTPSGQIQSLANPQGGKRSYTYDANDRLATITDPSGVAVTYAYDASGQLSTTTNAAGLLYRSGYDKEGHTTSTTDGANRTWAYKYDGDGRLTGLTAPGGGTYNLTYDAAGRLITHVNPTSTTVTFTRDQAGNITQTSLAGTNPASFTLTTSLKRNANGSVTEYTDPNGSKWGFTLDALERPVTLTDPLGNTTTLTYDKQKLSGATLPLGTLAITTDGNGRITKRQYSDGTILNKAYDANGMIVSANGFTVTRDAVGRPTAVNGIAVTLDAADRAKSFTYATGKTITYGYDAAGRVISVSDWLGGTTSLTYDGAGQITSITYPNGVRTTQAWDLNGRLDRIVMGSLGSISLVRNATGLVTNAERNLPSKPKLNVADTPYTYDAASQMVGASYDKMGRATSQSGRTYTWNLASQLTGFTANGQTTSLTYDGLAELSSLTTGGTTRNFVFNHLVHIPALSIVRQGAGDLRYYVYLPSGRLLYSVEANGGARHFYHFDEMGNTAFLTADDGKVSDTYAITPFGEVADRTGSTDNPFTWQGQFGVYEEAQGLYFMRSRHYDATASRFLSRDPEMDGDPRNAAPYVYAENNPMSKVDPLGNSANEAQAAAITAFLTDPSTTAEQRRGVYQLLSERVQDAWLAGRIDFLPAVTAQALLSIAYDRPDLDLTEVFAAIWPPDPPPPPPPPYVPPAPPLVVGAAVPIVNTAAAPAARLVPSCGKCTQALLNPAGIVSHDGGSLVGNDGSSVVSNDGGTIVSHDGGSVVSNDGGTIVSHDGGSLISQDGSNIVSQGGGNIVSQGGGNIVAQGGLNIVAQGGLN